MARIRKHRNKWQVLYRDPATNRERSAGVFTRKGDADRQRRVLEHQLEVGEWIDPGLRQTVFSEWARKWLTTRSHLAPKTWAGYESLLRSRVLPRFGATRLQDLRTIDIEAWISDLAAEGLSASRIRQAHQLLSAVVKAAVRNRMLVYNPAEGIELPRATMREQLFMTPVQVATLASEVPDHLAAFVLVLGVAGLRFGEAAALNRSDVDVVGRRIRVCRSVTEVYTLARGVELVFGETKARRSRSVAIPPHLAATLNDYIMRDEILDPKALIFTASNGAILRAPNFLSQVLRPALRRAGLNPRIRTHDLRHSAAAAMIAVNPNPELIKRQLGHSSIRVTFDVYGHLFPDESDKMADALETLWNADQMRTRPVALVATLDS